MFDHISIGVRDIAKAKAFYDAALKPLGLPASAPTRHRSAMAKRRRFLGQCGRAPGCRRSQVRAPLLLHRAEPRERRRFHKAAVAHGGRDNGKPGVRKDYGPNYYAAFVHDPEGYRLEAYYGGK